MNLLQVFRGSKAYGPRVLFDQVGLSINESEHIGVIGPNGAGKTTLFKIIAGQDSLDSGELIKINGLRIGYLEQESDWNLEFTSEEYLKQNSLMPIWNLRQLGLDLGLTDEHFKRPLSQLSGGYRMRMKLLGLIGLEPHLMLLDEPTNFLDLESLLALEKFLQNYAGAFLLISHDREFLRRTTESTLEIEAGDMTKFPGHIDDYFEQKAQLQEVLQAQASNQEAKRKHIQSFVDRFRAKATKAKQAQSRMKQLEKMQVIEIKSLPVRAKIKLPPLPPTGKEIVLIENANVGYADKVILTNVNIRLEKGVHLGVVGYNGAGKSTLLKSLAERIPLLSGTKKWGYQASFSYFAQHVTEDLNIEETVLGELQRAAHPDVKAQEILNMAGCLLFSGDDVKKKIKVLSGGEKTRVALGQILLKRNSLLILDEPTNHLDFDTVEALTEALRTFEGSLIVVSHDRSFIRRVASQILEIRDGRVEIYPGTYDEYVWSLEKGALKEQRLSSQTPTESKELSSSVEKSLSSNYYETSKKLQSEIREFQKKVQKSEERLLSENLKRDQLSQDLLKVQGPMAAQIAKELSLVSLDIEQIETAMLEHMESLEIKQKNLRELKGS